MMYKKIKKMLSPQLKDWNYWIRSAIKKTIGAGRYEL